jgi:type IV pilus assembly protein PilV
MDRIRANPEANYAVPNLTGVTIGTSLSVPRDQDLSDFANNIANFAGTTNGSGSSIVINGRIVTITVQWCDLRALNVTSCNAAMQSFVLTSRVAIDKGIK